MINLLPYELKKQTRAAHLNVVLLNYIVILSIAIGFIVIICAGSYTFLGMTKVNNDILLAKPAQKTSSTAPQDKTTAFKNNLSTAKTILDQQISYGDIITGLGALLPKGTAIDSLVLNDSSFGSPMNLKIRAASADLEPMVKAGFSSSPMFSGYNLVSTNQEAGYPNYPYAINISITLNRTVSR